MSTSRPPRATGDAARGRRRHGGNRLSSERRRWAGSRRRASPAAWSAVSLRGAAPSRTRSVSLARIGVAATEPSATRTSRHTPPSARQESGHHDLRDRLGAARADLPEADLAAMRQRDAHPQHELVVAARSCFGTPARSLAATVRSPARLPSTISASVASSTGSVSPAGEALTMLPPIVPRFWICAAPIVAAASHQRRQVLSAQVASGGYPCTSSARPGRGGRHRSSMPRSSSSRHRSSTRSGGGPSSPVIWTMRSVPPAIGRQPSPPASNGRPRPARWASERRLGRHHSA